MANRDIIQELSDLGSALGDAHPKNTYSVPDGYFDQFPARILELVKADGSNMLESLPRTIPYTVPAGYFDGLGERIMEVIRNHPDYQNSDEELEVISPLLNTIRKRPVYSVPQGYFENFNVGVEQQHSRAKVVSIPGRKWLRYAAAAIIIGAMAVTGLFVFNRSQKDPAGKTLAKLEKDVKKIDDVKKTQNLIDLMDAGLNEKQLASNHPTVKTEDVQQLLKDISSDELKDFNDQSKDMEDVMITN